MSNAHQGREDAKGNAHKETTSEQHAKVGGKRLDGDEGNDEGVVDHEGVSVSEPFNEPCAKGLHDQPTCDNVTAWLTMPIRLPIRPA